MAEILPSPHDLRGKVTAGSNKIDEEKLAQAERMVADLQGNYLRWVEEDLANLQRLYGRAVAEPAAATAILAEMHGIAHDVKGQGGSFGYALMTELGHQLCRFISAVAGRAVGPAELAAIKLHLDAMRVVIAERREGDGGAEGEAMLQGLATIAAKLTR